MEHISLAEYHKMMGLIKKGGSKMQNKRTEYNGTTYDSKKEASYARILDLRQRAGEITSYEIQKTYHFIINKVKVCSYRADFVIHYPDKTVDVVDVKSEFTKKLPVYRIKKKLMKAVYGIDIKEA